MTRLLFVGNFLSRQRGSYSVSEFIAKSLSLRTCVECELTSTYENKIIRILDIITKTLFYKANFVHIDVYSGNAFNIARVTSFIAFLTNKKIILTLHGGKLPEFSIKNKDKIVSLFRKAYLIQTPSYFLQKHFSNYGFSIDYLPNPIDLSRFPYNRNNVNFGSILWVRAFSEIYNPLIAIYALKYIRNVIPNATLTMVGPDGGLLDDTKKLIVELGLSEYVHIAGSVNNTELYKFYQTHNVYINTTSYESFGVALMEAASCGIPIVTSCVGEIPYLWKNDYDCLMVDDLNPNFFAEKVVSLINDSTLANTISTNAKALTSDFSWENIQPMWLQKFQINV